MKFKKYIMQSLLPVVATAWLFGSVCACSDEDVPGNNAPTLTVSDATNILRKSVILNGSISGESSQIKDYGFEYSESENYPADKTTRVSMIDEGTTTYLSKQVKDLSPDETYYYRMYATTGATTVYSNSVQFRTANMSSPQITNIQADSIGETSVILSFDIEDYGNEVLIEVGVGYKKKSAKNFISMAADSLSANDHYVIEIPELEAATEYDFRPYAKNAEDAEASTGSIEGYGEVLSTNTAALLSAELTTGEISDGDIKISSVTVSATIKSAVGSMGAVDECGFVYSATNTLPTYNSDSKLIHKPAALSGGINVSAKAYSYTETITDLLQTTTYYIRAYAKNTVQGATRIAYGEVREITTAQLKTPMLEWLLNNDNGIDISTTATTITAKARITNYDAGALIEKGLIWSKTTGDITLDQAKTDKTFLTITNGEAQIVGTIEGLEMSTSYYVRAYAVYKSGDLTEVGYTGWNSAYTQGLSLPSLDIEVIGDSTTYTTMVLQGKIPSSGNANIVETGFVLSSKGGDLTMENYEFIFKADEQFRAKATGLNPNTSYWVRAYAKCELAGKNEIAYSWTAGTSTQSLRPEFNTMNWSAGQTSITMQGDVKASEVGTIVAVGFCAVEIDDEQYEDPTVEGLHAEQEVTSAESIPFNMTLSELKENTRYRVRPYAKVKINDDVVIAYQWNTDVRTKRIPSQDDNTSPDKKD